jgi:hypothetical protein
MASVSRPCLLKLRCFIESFSKDDEQMTSKPWLQKAGRAFGTNAGRHASGSVVYSMPRDSERRLSRLDNGGMADS